MAAVGNFLGGLAVLLAIVVLVVYLTYRKRLQRRRELAAYAAARGWRFEAEQPLLVDRFTGPPFGLGQSRRAYNAILGSHDGRELVAFDYDYETKAGFSDTSQTKVHVFTCVALRTGVSMPPLAVDPEGFMGSVVGRVTGHDIDLESDDFNRTFTVSCPDRRFASDVLHPQMMEYLLHYPHLGWRFDQDSMLVVAEGAHPPPQIEATIQVMDGIMSRVPEFVWLRLRGQG